MHLETAAANIFSEIVWFDQPGKLLVLPVTNNRVLGGFSSEKKIMNE